MCNRHNATARKAIITATPTSTMARSGFTTIETIGSIAKADIKSLPDNAGRTVKTFSATQPLCLSARWRSSWLPMVSRSVARDPTQTAQNGGRRRWSIQRGARVGPMALGGFGSRYGKAAELWWATRDSNPDELPHTPLKRARLPVPPAARLQPVDSTEGPIRRMNRPRGLLNFRSSNEHVGVVGPPAEDLRHRRGGGRDRVDRLCPRHPLPAPRSARSHSRGRHRRSGSSGARLRCMCMGIDAVYRQRQVGLGADEHLDRTVGGRRDRVVLFRGRPEDPHAVSVAG